MAKHSKTNPVDDQFMIKGWMCKLEEEIVSSTMVDLLRFFPVRPALFFGKHQTKVWG
jgi:hypothetical protein